MTDSGKNVIIVVIDALRPDYLNSSTAPWIEQLSSEGVEFPNTFSPINTTEPLLASFYTGKYPRTTGVLNHGTNLTRGEISRLTDETFIQERFRSRGYTTLAFDWLGRWHESGFDTYSGKISPDETETEKSGQAEQERPASLESRGKQLIELFLSTSPPPLVEYLTKAKHQFVPPTVTPSGWLPDPANVLVDEALETMQTQSAPWYLFLHFWDTHAPYDVPKEYVEPFGGIQDPVARYQGAIAFVDRQLERLYTELALEFEEPPLILIMGDHGESLGEHSIYYDHHGLYDPTIHVPVIMHDSSLPDGETVHEFIQHVDLAPTLLDIVFDELQNGFDGQSLLPTIYEERPIRDRVFSEEAQTQRKAAIRSEQYKFIKTIGDSPVCNGCHFVHGGARELYDLRADPDETNNLVSSHPEVAAELEEELDEWRTNPHPEQETIRNILTRLVDDTEFRSQI